MFIHEVEFVIGSMGLVEYEVDKFTLAEILAALPTRPEPDILPDPRVTELQG
jgi:hypothetical protein